MVLTLKNKRTSISFFVALILLELVFLSNLMIGGKANGSIPEEYYQELDMNCTYSYNILRADSSYVQWYGIDSMPKGDVETIAGNQINVNISGFYEKHTNDYSSFPDPAPYIDIEFVGNATFQNITNAEASMALTLGYFGFLSGFLVPADMTWLKDVANNTEYEQTDFSIIEMESTIYFDFIQVGGPQRTELIYNITSGILLWAKTRIGFNTFEICLEGFTPPSSPATTPTINPFLVVIVVSGIIGTPFLFVPKIDNKHKKYILFAMFGTSSFMLLFNYNYSLYYIKPNLEEEVYDIKVSVDYGNGTIAIWEDLTLTDYKTSAFNALDSCCDVDYTDYGWGIFINSVDGIGGGFSSWTYTVNGEFVKKGASVYALHSGDNITWTYS